MIDERIEQIISYDELSKDQQVDLAKAVSADPALASFFSDWRRLRESLREAIASGISSRQLLVLYALDGEGSGDLLTPEERLEVEQARPVIEQAIAEQPVFQDIINRILEDRQIFEELWADYVESSSSKPVRAARPSVFKVTSPAMRWTWRVAAVFLVGLFVGVLYLLYQRDASYEVIATADGQTTTVELADGSQVRLIENSTLYFIPPGGATTLNRQARLERGGAFFDVAPGDQNFRLETSNAIVHVMGTAFGIKTDENETSVTLASGRISLASRLAPAQAITLDPGQTSRVLGRAAPSTAIDVDLTRNLSWTGLFVFKASRLDDIADVLAEHYDVDVEVDSELANEAITGTFEHDQPAEEIINTLASALGAEVVRTPLGFRLTSAG